MQTLSTIASHVPLWVWAILALLLALGYRQSRKQLLSRQRLVLPALAWLAYGAWGVYSSFGASIQLLLAWALSLLLAMQLMRLTAVAAGSDFDPQSQRYFVPGSWLPMALMLALFAAKFTLGMSLALHPELAGKTSLATGFSALFGALSGALLGRARNILHGPAQQDSRAPAPATSA